MTRSINSGVSIRNFNKWYAYIIQITRLFDKILQKEYVFTSYLSKFIPNDNQPALDIEDKLKLEYYRLEQTFKGDISLNPNAVVTVLENPKKTEVALKPSDATQLLDEIIRNINELFNGKLGEADRILVGEFAEAAISGDKKLEMSAKNNDFNIFARNIFPVFFEETAMRKYDESVESFDQSTKAYQRLWEEPERYQAVMSAVAKIAYKVLRSR